MMQVGYRPPMMRMPMQAAQAQMMMQAGVHPQMPPNMPVNMAMPPMGMPNMINTAEMGFDGKMLRKSVARKTVDYNPSVVKYLEDRIWKKDFCDDRSLQADPLYTQQLTLPQHMIDNPVSCIMTKFIRAALNKDPRPVFCVCWTPDGRRLITGASSGEFTLWNGLTFNFETILQAHNSAVRSMIWSHNEQWMLTGDDKGYVKYWQANMNNVKMFQGHFEAIRGLSFSPTDAKFTSCSDDRTVRIFDFVTCTEENVLQGHGSDVKCVDWHPYKGVIISGSKDSQQPIILWDAKNAKKITTIHAHKNTCTDLKWNRFNGNWLVSSSRDHLCKLFDIRNLKEEVQSFRGHKKDACTIAWHPVYEKLFASGGADGSLFFWVVGVEKEVGSMEEAHDGMIWDLSWHPLGHMLVSGSNDRSTRFWTRNRPGDTVVDKTDEISTPKAERSTGIIFKNIELPEPDKQSDGTVNLPGLGLDNEMLDILNEEYRSESPPTTMSPRSTMAPFFPIINYQYLQQQQQQQQEQYQQPGQSQMSQLPAHLQQQFQQPPPQLQQVKRDAQQPGVASNEIEDDETRRKKAPYSKPIPKEFEMAWKSNRPMTQPPPPLPPNTLLQLSNPPPPLPPHVANSIQQPMPPIGLMPPGPIPGLMNSGPMPLIHNMPPSSQPLMMPSTNIPPPHHHHHHHHHHQQQQQSQQQQQANSNQQQPQQNTSNNQSFKNQPFNQQQKLQQSNNNPSSSSNSQNNNNNNNNNNNQNKSSNIKQPMSSIFDLMAAEIEPPNNYNNNNNNKRKLSQDSNVNDSDQDERQWQPKNKQFYNKNNDNLDENAGGDFYNRNYNRRQGARDYSGSQSISSYEENNEGNEDDNDAGEYYNEEQQQQGSYRNRSASGGGGGGGSSFRGRPRINSNNNNYNNNKSKFNNNNN